MKPPIPDDGDVAAALRRQRAARRAGDGAQCKCGVNDASALIPGRDPAICYECDRRAKGRSTVDQHHPAGRSNNPATIAVLVNDHRLLSEAQRRWPNMTLRNPEQDPLRRAAAEVRGFIDTILYLIEKLLRSIPAALELLAEILTARLGERWWEVKSEEPK